MKTTKKDLEKFFRQMVEHEIRRQLKLIFGNEFEIWWMGDIFPYSQQIKVDTEKFSIILKVHIEDGRVRLLGLENKLNKEVE